MSAPVPFTATGLAAAARRSATGEAHSSQLPPHRTAMRRALVGISVAVAEGRADAADRALIDAALSDLEATARPSGLFGGGDNGESPPDSAFTVNDICRAARILSRHAAVPGLEGVAERLRPLAARTIRPLSEGGVHTPNHRWELAAALAALGEMLDDPSPLRAAELWLSEGVDIDADGMFSERSANYASHVSGPCLVLLSRLLRRPDLAEAVVANLRATLPLIDERGRVETVHSRRQDQTVDFDAEPYLPLLRWAARRTGNGAYTTAVDGILARGLTDPGSRLAEFLDEPDDRAMPAARRPEESATTILPRSGLTRWRDGARTTTLFAGSDFAATRRIASGLSNSSTIIRAHEGDAQLRALRIAPEFFGIGALRPHLTAGGAQRALLEETRAAAFYGPLPAALRRRDGAYPLSADGRFFAAMAFDARPQDPHTLRTAIEVERRADGFTADVRWVGADTPVAVELVFPEDHALTGTSLVTAGEHIPLGDRVVATAPSGAAVEVAWLGAEPPSVRTAFDEGESFTAVGGHDRVPGLRLLIPTRTTRQFRLEVAFTRPRMERIDD